MRIKTPIAVATCLICVVAVLPGVSSQMNSSDVAAAVTKLENDQVKAALANDVSFIKTNPAKNKTNSMTISDLKVSAHGNVAIARYLDTYDDIYHGQHRSRSVICTDTWANEDGAWKLVAGHCSQKK